MLHGIVLHGFATLGIAVLGVAAGITWQGDVLHGTVVPACCVAWLCNFILPLCFKSVLRHLQAVRKFLKPVLEEKSTAEHQQLCDCKLYMGGRVGELLWQGCGLCCDQG